MEEKMKTGGIVEMQDQIVRKHINSELWHTCAGPLVSLPQIGSLVYYFPQGHIEQVAISAKLPANSPIPNDPSLPPQLLCQIHNVTLHADKDTDEIFAQMSLQPIQSDKDILPISDSSSKPSKHPTEFFCKTLTASDTSSHGGFSVPRRAAEKLFPQLDYSIQPPSQELVVRDLHDNSWTFRHIFRGQPKRHLLTTGWSTFVSSKRLRAGDSILFMRDDKSQLMVGVRRANRQQTTLPSSVLSADSMHIGVLAAASHAAINRSPFTVFYNPRSCPSDFVIPVYKYRKAVHGPQVSAGMGFGMMFETEESGKRRYTGTVVGVSDLDPLRWPGSKWRCLRVEWDEPGSSDKPNRVSHWEIETPESLFLFNHPFVAGFMGGEFEWRNPLKRPLIPAPDSEFGSQPYPSIPNLYSEQLTKMLSRPPTMPTKPQTNAFADKPQVKKMNTNQTPPSTSPKRAKMEPVAETASTVTPPMDASNLDGLLPDVDVPDWTPTVPLPPVCQEPWTQQDDTNTQSEIYSCLDFDGANMLDPSVSSALLGDLGMVKDEPFQYSTDCLLGSFGTRQDLQDFPDNSSVEFDDSSVLLNSSWQQVNPPTRTYTKVQKAGSVGRSIDVTSFRTYNELRSAIEDMFGLQGLLKEPKAVGWKLVYVDFENDVLLVGDDPWEEFVSCVRCIRILSPAEVQQMSLGGMQLL